MLQFMLLFNNIILFINDIGFGARGRGPHYLAQVGQRGAHHFELQPLVCSGKVITLTQHAVHYPGYQSNNKQPAGPLILGLVT